MTDLLKTGIEWLGAQRKAHASSPVTYWRGLDTAEVLATVGQTAFRLTNDYGIEMLVVMRDYLIATADLVLGGQVVTPQAGDLIQETDGDEVTSYEVMGPGNGEPEWRWSDAWKTTLRIHTKQVGTES